MRSRFVYYLIMGLFFILAIYILLLRSNNNASVVGDIESSSPPAGLYLKNDKVKVLDVNNFDENIYNSSNGWLIQFYNAWCGHCISFSPIYKKFADDVYNWKSIVTVAAINCADDRNTQLCRDFEIMGYPTIRYFGPMKSKNDTDFGSDFVKDDRLMIMRHQLVEEIMNTKGQNNWPNLSFIIPNNLSELWSTIYTDKDFLVLVTETEDSLTGAELILDFFYVPNLIIRRTTNHNLFIKNERTVLPTIYIIYKNLTYQSLRVRGEDREDFYKSLAEFLIKRGLLVFEKLYMTRAAVETITKPSTNITMIENKEILVNNVYAIDLETAIKYSLFHEISLHSHISDEKSEALIKYLEVLEKFLPSKLGANEFIKKLKMSLNDKSLITGGEFKALVTDLSVLHYPGFETRTNNNNWFGCKGSSLTYRGYPCGLWLLAHTLTVNAHDVQPTEVLKAFAGYVKHFFGCTECTKHFLQMASSIETNVTNLDENILWLWKAHNSANRRLSKDSSEDPMFPKMQFPTPKACPDCYTTGGESWNEMEVLKYLKKMYTQIISAIPNLTSVSTKDKNGSSLRFKHEKESGRKKSLLNDFHTWIGLYIICVCLIAVYIIKLVFFKKRSRTKHFRHDFTLNKHPVVEYIHFHLPPTRCNY